MSSSTSAGETRRKRLALALLLVLLLGAASFVAGATLIWGWPGALLAGGVVAAEVAVRLDVL